MYPTPTAWLLYLCEQARAERLPHLDILINSTGLDSSTLEELAELVPQPQYANLLDGTPEQALQGPHLIRLAYEESSHYDWLHTLIETTYGDFRVLALLSPWPFDDLSQHLCTCTQAEWNQGEDGGLLRYWEPRLLRPISEAFTPEQSRWFHRAVINWYWLDRDNKTEQLTGWLDRSTQPQPTQALTLSNEQVAELIAWTEAEDFRMGTGIKPQDCGLGSREMLARHLFHAQRDADRASIYDSEQRRAHIRQWLLRYSTVAPQAPQA